MKSVTNPDGSATKTLTYDMKTLLVAAANTGIGAGLVSYLAFPEAAFLKPAMYTGISAAGVFYLMPSGSAMTRSIAIGAGMGLEVLLFAAGRTLEGVPVAEVPFSGALRFAALGAVAAYISTEFIAPKLLRAENEVRRDFKF